MKHLLWTHEKMIKRLVPTLAALLGHDGGDIQLETAQHHSGAEELPVHGLRCGESKQSTKNCNFVKDRTNLNPKQ